MNIAVVHAGGLGDMVLAETLLAGLRERHAGASVTLFCRADVAQAASLYAVPPERVCTFEFDPYRWALPSEAALALAPFLVTLPDTPVDLFVAAELKSTWLGEVLAAALAPREAVLSDANVRAGRDLLILLRLLGLRRNDRARRLAPVADEHELDRYARLAQTARRLPALRELPASPGGDEPYVVVFPAGAPSLKLWAHESLRDAAARIAEPRNARVVAVGSRHERAALEAFAHDGSLHCDVFAGDPDDLAATAALLARACGYVGTDGGLAHLAAAYGVPGVTVYGGGTWPSYAPWGRFAAGVVAPIPCFGCQWDCAFDRAFCIEPISVDAVVSAFDHVARDNASGPHVVTVKAYDERERTILGAAARVHRAAQLDRGARLTAIVRLQDILRRYVRRARNQQARANAALSEITHRVSAAAKRLTEQHKR
jgi:ADP-heptose:LPS heptosyltransferase